MFPLVSKCSRIDGMRKENVWWGVRLTKIFGLSLSNNSSQLRITSCSECSVSASTVCNDTSLQTCQRVSIQEQCVRVQKKKYALYQILQWRRLDIPSGPAPSPSYHTLIVAQFSIVRFTNMCWVAFRIGTIPWRLARASRVVLEHRRQTVCPP